MDINYYAIAVGAVLAMAIAWLWYGPIFGKKWLAIADVDPADLETRKAMMKDSWPFYLIQFVLTLLQVYVLAVLIAYAAPNEGIKMAVWVWAAFVIPTLAAAVMWTNEANERKWGRFWIQGSYYLLMFIIYGAMLQYWK